jgi:hypothetical protein
LVALLLLSKPLFWSLTPVVTAGIGVVGTVAERQEKPQGILGA